MARGFGAKESGFGLSKSERDAERDANYNQMDDPAFYPKGGTDEPDEPTTSSRNDNRVPGGPEDQAEEWEDDKRQMLNSGKYYEDEDGNLRRNLSSYTAEELKAKRESEQARYKMEDEKRKERAEKTKSTLSELKVPVLTNPAVERLTNMPKAIVRDLSTFEDYELGVETKGVPLDDSALADMKKYIGENKSDLYDELEKQIYSSAQNRTEEGDWSDEELEAEAVFSVNGRDYVLTTIAIGSGEVGYEPNYDFESISPDNTRVSYNGPTYLNEAKEVRLAVSRVEALARELEGEIYRSMSNSPKASPAELASAVKNKSSEYGDSVRAAQQAFQKASVGQPPALVGDGEKVFEARLAKVMNRISGYLA